MHAVYEYLSQPYVRNLAQAVAEGRVKLPPGTVAFLEIRHDDDCPWLAGGLCRCRPEMDLVVRPVSSEVR